MNIYVGNLPYNVRDEELRQAFEPYGEVLSAEVIMDRRSRRSRGYGFVEMANDADAINAIEALDGSDMQGRSLRVDESRPNTEKRSRRAPSGNQDRNERPNAGADTRGAGGTESKGLLALVKRLFG
jgi:RNA recognition motif-containing protein